MNKDECYRCNDSTEDRVICYVCFKKMEKLLNWSVALNKKMHEQLISRDRAADKFFKEIDEALKKCPT